MDRKLVEPKQVIVVRKDLKMPVGKIAAQVAHASLGAILKRGFVQESEFYPRNNFVIPMTNEMQQWLTGRFTKVCLAVNSEKELLEIYNEAETAGLPCALITDAGFTVFNGEPKTTCAGIGPASPEFINNITGHLKLLR